MNKKLIAGAWLVFGLACAQAQLPATNTQPWRVRLASGQIEHALFTPAPIHVATVAGMRTFEPQELTGIEFPRPMLCVVSTVYRDRWYAVASPLALRHLVGNGPLGERWDQIQSVTFLASSNPVPDLDQAWRMNLFNGSVVHLILDPAAVALQTPAGRLEVPLGLVKNLRTQPVGPVIEAVVEILPGGYALRGTLAGPPLRGTDLGGHPLSMPWKSLELLSRAQQPVAELSTLQQVQPVTVRLADGTTVAGNLPVSLLTVRGRGGPWILPTTRLRELRRNSNGSFSVHTVAGEWISGDISPAALLLEGQPAPLPLNRCAAVVWTNAPVQLPGHYASWRLKSGDLIAGEWQPAPPPAGAAVVPLPQVIEPAQPASARIPVMTDGKWPVARFDLRHWASGIILPVPASALETVRGVAPGQMPPAIPPAGPSAMWSDEALLPGGTFRMGRLQGDGPRDEIPPVDLSVESFWLARTPVTVTQFAAFVAATRHVTDAEQTAGAPSWRAPGFGQRPDDPVVCVSWRDAVKYCNWLSDVSGLAPCYGFRDAGRGVQFLPERNGYRLPMEAEWEFAARAGGQDQLYPWGEEQRESVVAGLANFRAGDAATDPWPWTNPVKAYPPTSGGLYDMGGNVWQWCQDIYREDAYAGLARGEGLANLLNSDQPTGLRRAMRGGSYNNPLEFLRCAARGYGVENMSAPRVGFRVARKAEKTGP